MDRTGAPLPASEPPGDMILTVTRAEVTPVDAVPHSALAPLRSKGTVALLGRALELVLLAARKSPGVESTRRCNVALLALNVPE